MLLISLDVYRRSHIIIEIHYSIKKSNLVSKFNPREPPGEREITMNLRIKHNPSQTLDGISGTVDAALVSQTVSHQDLVAETAKASGQPEATVKAILAAHAQAMAEHLLAGDAVQLAEIGDLRPNVRNVELRANGDIREGTPKVGVLFIPGKPFLAYLNANATFTVDAEDGVCRPRLDSLKRAGGGEPQRGSIVELRGARLKFNRAQHGVGVFFTAPGKPDVVVRHYLSIHSAYIRFVLPDELESGTAYTVQIRAYLIGRALRTAQLSKPVVVTA